MEWQPTHHHGSAILSQVFFPGLGQPPPSLPQSQWAPFFHWVGFSWSHPAPTISAPSSLPGSAFVRQLGRRNWLPPRLTAAAEGLVMNISLQCLLFTDVNGKNLHLPVPPRPRELRPKQAKAPPGGEPSCGWLEGEGRRCRGRVKEEELKREAQTQRKEGGRVQEERLGTRRNWGCEQTSQKRELSVPWAGLNIILSGGRNEQHVSDSSGGQFQRVGVSCKFRCSYLCVRSHMDPWRTAPIVSALPGTAPHAPMAWSHRTLNTRASTPSLSPLVGKGGQPWSWQRDKCHPQA